MEFAEKLKDFCGRLKMLKSRVKTEEATKTSMIMPFFSLLGYDVFNPLEFAPEYIADVGIKKGEKVDYAILDKKQNPVILVEAKCCNENLVKHGAQLFRYFSTTPAKFGILTNGITYQFYTDLTEQNKMDSKPFLVVNLLNLKDGDVSDLQQFQKDIFSVECVLAKAEELNYNDQIRQALLRQLDNPDAEFVSYVITDIYKGRKTQKVIDDFRPIVKKALGQLINEKINERLQSVLDDENIMITAPAKSAVKSNRNKSTETVPSSVPTITNEKTESYLIIKAILFESLNGRQLNYKDGELFEIYIGDNVSNWICRIDFNMRRIYINVPSAEKEFMKRQFRDVQDFYFYQNILCNAVTLLNHLI